MKTARVLPHFGALLGLAALFARADNTLPAATPVPVTPPPAASAAPAPLLPTPTKGISSPTLQSFPIPPSLGAPTDFTTELNNDPERIAEQTYFLNQEKGKESTVTNLEAVQRQQAYDDNWMMRGYAEQLKKRGLETSPEFNALLVTDPNPPKSATPPPDSAQPQTDATKKKLPQRPSSSLLGDNGLLTPKKSLVTGPFQPLLSQISDPATSYKDPWASTSSLENDMASLASSSGASLLPVPGSIPEGAGRTTSLAPADTGLSSLLDIPGLTAETQGSVAPNNALAFQDPGENETTSPQHPRTSASNFLVPTAPTSDITDFFKKQALALQSPTAPSVSAAPVAPGMRRLPLTPVPLAKPAPVTTPGMRLHVDDPFDILRR